jgi:hypothetical protein
VKLTVAIANVEGPVTIARSVDDPLSPTITPDTPVVLEALRQVALHPEFALSRRELIRYVLSTPGDRAKEVQALLRLDAVDSVRAIIQKITNGCQRAVGPLARAKGQARDQLLAALQIPEWNTARVLAAVNEKRQQLGFPNTQFILTTHDEIWLRHMKSAGLIAPGAFIHFRTWDVENGPTEWDDRDIWQEIESEVARDDIRAAAGLLRHYLEFASAEICHVLRAPVEFRGDAQFQLGDLLPAAIGKLGSLLREGKSVAQSWGRPEDMKAIEDLESGLKTCVAATKVDQWQVNSAVHYNAWADLHKEDFQPVVNAYRKLMESFACSNPKCMGLFYVQPERGTREGVRCACGNTHINLRKE